MSNPKLVTCGVPQGTILGPLLFLRYINDLPNCLHFSQPRMYADDTSLTYASADLKLINRDLQHRRRNGTTTPIGSEIFPREPSRHA